MSSLRWLKLNRTGLCYLPEELAALQKLVRARGAGARRPHGTSNNRAELWCVAEMGCGRCWERGRG